MNAKIIIGSIVFAGSCPGVVSAQYSYSGTTGYINSPSALHRGDGDVVVGYSHAQPYDLLYIGTQALPWLEFVGRYTQTKGVPGLPNAPEYGSYKDKSFAFKAQIWGQNAAGIKGLPALSLGAEDAFLGTQVFKMYYLALGAETKIGGGSAEWTLGYGKNRMNGVFAGIRYSHSYLPGWAWVSDYDRINFKNDYGANSAGLDKRGTGQFNHAIEYQSPAGYAIQIGKRDGQFGVNLHLSAPFGRRKLASKTAEPAPYISFDPSPDLAAWLEDSKYELSLRKKLHEAGFRDVQMTLSGRHLRVAFASNRYYEASMAVGRAVRILLAHVPQELQQVDVTLLEQGMRTVSYAFSDLKKIQGYMAGSLPLAAVKHTVRVEWASAEAFPRPMAREHAIQQALQKALADDDASLGDDGTKTSLVLDRRWSSETFSGHSWSIGPRVEIFFNDPSGAFKGALGVEAAGRARLGPSTYLDGALTARLFENITDVHQASNSLLPHVRSDIAEYYRGSAIKLEKLVLNHYWQPARRWYTRASLGAYETMYAGLGGQVLYTPENARWAADWSADYVIQRDYSEPFKFRDYQILTTTGALHMKLPYDSTATLRAGRFLAGDSGARFEFKRELPSGVQFGFWYTITNGKDTTNPGSEAKPYRDKGVFMSIPLDVVSDRHSKRMINMSIAPWTRDVGQMVRSPHDLWGALERGVLNPLQNNRKFQALDGVDAGESE